MSRVIGVIEETRLLEEVRRLDEAYMESERQYQDAYAKWLSEHPEFDPDEDYEEGPDPVRDGWIGSDGRP